MCRYCIGLNLLREERPRDAEAAFRTAVGYAPADYEFAKLRVRSDRVSEAVPILDRLIKAHPEAEKYYQLRARAARLLSDFDSAADFQDQADRSTQVFPSDELTGFLEEQIGRHGLDIWIQESRDLLAAGSVAAAAARLKGVLDHEWRQEAADLLAHSELVLGHVDLAIQILNKAVVRSGSTPQRLVALGDAQHRRGDDEQAIQSWNRAARLGRNQLAHERLAEHHERLGAEQEAVRHRALASLAAGITAERTGQLDPAVQLLQRAVASSPLLSHAWYHLGECRRLLNEFGPAEQAYRQCLNVDPYHGRATRSLNRVVASQ